MTVFMPGEGCYRCVNPRPSSAEGCRSCANAGVLGPVPGLIGCIQAIEVIKLAQLLCTMSTGENSSVMKLAASARLQPLVGRQLYVDATTSSFHEFQLPRRNPDCAVCGNSATIVCIDDTEADLGGAAASVPFTVDIPVENKAPNSTM